MTRITPSDLRAQANDLRNCNPLPRIHRDTQDEIDAAATTLDSVADLIETITPAPAVTVTEEDNSDEYRLAVAYQVIGCFLDHLGVFDTAGGQGLLDYFAKHDGAKDPLPFSVADLASSPRKSERDAALEEAAQVADAFESGSPDRVARESAVNAAARVACRIRALKSTTPQTGSQE